MVEEVESESNSYTVIKTKNLQKVIYQPSFIKNYSIPVCISDVPTHPLNGIVITDIDLSKKEDDYDRDYGIALDNTGKVYFWGYFNGDNVFDVELDNYTNNSKANIQKVGAPAYEYVYEPTCINTLPDSTLADVVITKISAGYGHSLFLDSEGKIWSFGKGGEGEYIRGNEGDAYFDYMPICINDFERETESNTEYTSLDGVVFADISAGHSISMALDSDGNVWSWGYNYGHTENWFDLRNYSPLDFHEEDYTVNKLSNHIVQKVESLDYNSNIPVCLSKAPGNPFYGKKATKVSAGCYWHALILDTNGKVWGFGYEWSYRDDDGDSEWIIVPEILGTNTSEDIYGKTITDICAGWSSSGMIDSEGNYYLYGQFHPSPI